MIPNHPIKAVLWDFDGTLADTRRRNLSVNRRIIQEITGRPWQDFAALTSVEAYLAAWERVGNWQELYAEVFGLSLPQWRAASQKWAPYQLDDSTPVPLFPGIRETLKDLKDYPQAVVSQNDRTIIARVLEDNGVDHFFSALVGYAEVPIDRQKPAPDGLLRALDILGVEEPATALYIGDHETDMLCAANANRDLTALGHELWFRFAAVDFIGGSGAAPWMIASDHRLHRPPEIGQLVASYSVQSSNA
jgi:phosphoglycolate phosphatase-like HAD superfamily hydrolase